MKRGIKGTERTIILSKEEEVYLKGVKNGMKLWRGEEEENKRVVDSFILQHPILDYVSGSCFLCVVSWPGPKKKLLKFHLICCRNSSV